MRSGRERIPKIMGSDTKALLEAMETVELQGVAIPRLHQVMLSRKLAQSFLKAGDVCGWSVALWPFSIDEPVRDWSQETTQLFPAPVTPIRTRANI